MIHDTGDINVDLWPDNDPMGRYDLKRLTEVYDILKEENGLSQCNFELTRFRRGQRPSLLDHFMTNTPAKIDGVKTTSNHTSEHSLVKLHVHSENLVVSPKFRKIRSFKNVNSDTLMEKI